MNRKNKTNKKVQNAALIKLLRAKQQKKGIKYLTTDSPVYRFFAVFSYIFFLITFFCNSFYILGNFGKLSSVYRNAKDYSEYVAGQISSAETNTITVLIATVFLVVSVVFLLLKKPVLQISFSLLPSVVCLYTIATGFNETLSLSTGKDFFFKFLLPTSLYVLFSAVASVICLRQKIKDKKGTQKISEDIYLRFSVTADSLTEEEWENLLAEKEEKVK